MAQDLLWLPTLCFHSSPLSSLPLPLRKIRPSNRAPHLELSLLQPTDHNDDNDDEPLSIRFIANALKNDDIAPQWNQRTAQTNNANSTSVPRLLPLREDELKLLEAMDEPQLQLSDHELTLLRRSMDSLDYLGNWSSTKSTDSIVLCCRDARVLPCVEGPEFTCALGSFTEERSNVHARIVARMLASHVSPATTPESKSPSGPLCTLDIDAAIRGDEQHIFVIVGVPGSGKDTVIKRYLRTLGLPLVDASADVVKEYLAAWGSDELSIAVRANDCKNGPGKHLLHAQYLHRESILVNDMVVERALERGSSIMLEKTLHSTEHVLSSVRLFSSRGCKVHLLGTLVPPLQNWEFVRNRMVNGAAFGRYITKSQVIATLRRYHLHIGAVLREPDLRQCFDSIHLYDVIGGEWQVSLPDTKSALFQEDTQAEP